MAYPFYGMGLGYPQSFQQAQPQPQSSIIWVQGEAGAKSYLVAPNTTVQLWDSESQTIYLKSADAAGMPSIKVIDYTIRETPAADPQASGKVDELAAEVAALRKELNELKEMNKRDPSV